MNIRWVWAFLMLGFIGASLMGCAGTQRQGSGGVEDKGEEAWKASFRVGMSLDELINVPSHGEERVDNHSVELKKDESLLCKAMLGHGRYLVMEVDDSWPTSKSTEVVTSIEETKFDDLRGEIPAGMFDLVKTIHLSPSIDVDAYRPAALIRAVNALRVVGKEKALAALEEYVALCGKLEGVQAYKYDLDEQRVMLIARVLFVRNDGKAQMPWLFLGAYSVSMDPDNEDWPLFPLVMRDDVPFCMAQVSLLAGAAELPEGELSYCRDECKVREHALQPSSSPVKALSEIFNSAEWKREFPKSEDGDDCRDWLEGQAIVAVGMEPGPGGDNDAIFERCLKDKRLMGARWDDAKGEFVVGR